MAIDVEFVEPDTPPSSSDAVNFRTRADTFVSYISAFVTKLIAFVTQINSTEANINAKEASTVAAYISAVALANYKGIFVQGTSSALIGESWSYNGSSYRCAVNTSNNPTTEPASWVSVSIDTIIHAATAKATPVGADEFGFWDSVSGLLRKVTFANLIAYFDTLYFRTTSILGFGNMPAGSVIQVQNYTTTTFASGTSQIPFDNTIPQITEGTQFMSLAFTAKKATSKLHIQVNLSGALTSNSYVCTAAVFKDSNANSIAAKATSTTASGSNINFNIPIEVEIDAVDTSSHTYTVRAGANGGVNTYLNGSSTGAGIFGGVSISSIRITEVAQ